MHRRDAWAGGTPCLTVLSGNVTKMMQIKTEIQHKQVVACIRALQGKQRLDLCCRPVKDETCICRLVYSTMTPCRETKIYVYITIFLFSLYLSIYSSIYLSIIISLSIYLSIYLSFSLSLHQLIKFR